MDNTTHNTQSTFEKLFDDASNWLEWIADSAEDKTSQWSDTANQKMEEVKAKYHEWAAENSDDDLWNKMSHKMNELESKATAKGYQASAATKDAMN
jgi:ElaB/YqjD/DUF883 family membrane-anchored ribosome-binding protein